MREEPLLTSSLLEDSLRNVQNLSIHTQLGTIKFLDVVNLQSVGFLPFVEIVVSSFTERIIMLENKNMEDVHFPLTAKELLQANLFSPVQILRIDPNLYSQIKHHGTDAFEKHLAGIYEERGFTLTNGSISLGSMMQISWGIDSFLGKFVMRRCTTNAFVHRGFF